MASLWNDLRYAVRGLLHAPGFAVLAMLTLALGIGANVAIFTVAKRVLLDPLPFPESERIMALFESNVELGYPRFSFAPPNYVDFRDRGRSFEALAAVTGGSFNLTGGDGPPERLSALEVTSEYHRVYRVEPELGRGIGPDDDRPDAEKVVVLGHGFWQRRFGGDPGVLGRKLVLSGEPHTVIGVMPPGFQENRDVLVPLAIDYAETSRGGHWLAVRGRLASGVTVEEARTEMVALAAELERAYPDTNTGWSAVVQPLHELAVEDFRSAVWLLLAAVALVLLIACVNVANLFLVRMAAREKQVALRSALGADRWRLVRQFLTESVLLALAGGGLGILLAIRGTELLVAINADDIPRSEEIAVDGGVLLFALGLSVAVGLAFGLAPALQASRPDLGETLKEGGRGQAGGARGQRLRAALVVAEVGLAVVLLVAAGLLLRSLSRLLDVDPGFTPEGALTARLDLPEAVYDDEPKQAAFYRRLLDELAALPGVEAVGGAMPLPLDNRGFILTFYVEGTPIPEPNRYPFSNIRIVTEGFFDAMRVPLVRGRTFARADDLDAPQVAVVNRSMAERYFPGQDPIGQRITFDDPEGEEEVVWMEIVGIVGDVHHQSLDTPTEPEIYWSYAQRPNLGTTLVVRTAASPESFAGALRGAIQRIDPDLPIQEIQTLEEIVASSVAQPRFRGVLLGLFAALALLLASIGVYGVISYSVAQRQREIGVRLALGADRQRVLGLVLGQGFGLVAVGLVAGLIVAVFATRILQTLIYGVSPFDPLTLLVVAAVLGTVGLLASFLPAWRAMRVDPVVVLREE